MKKHSIAIWVDGDDKCVWFQQKATPEYGIFSWSTLVDTILDSESDTTVYFIKTLLTSGTYGGRTLEKLQENPDSQYFCTLIVEEERKKYKITSVLVAYPSSENSTRIVEVPFEDFQRALSEMQE